MVVVKTKLLNIPVVCAECPYCDRVDNQTRECEMSKEQMKNEKVYG